ncbi:MAG: site-2 protease family protein [Eubacteriales bacterium]
MLLNYLRSGMSAREMLVVLLLTLPIILISLTVHEVAHGYVSYKQGDPTAYNLGRLSLNPLKHLDPIGALSMLIFGIGWAKPVPVNARYYKKPKRGMALTALAGPCANILLSFIGVIVFVILGHCNVFSHVFEYGGSVYYDPAYVWQLAIYLFIQNFITLNAYLAVFNLLPVPPFDGSRIAFVFLPDRLYFSVMKYERIIMLVVLILICTGVLTLPFGYLSDLLISGMTALVNAVWNGIAALFALF